jgi:hypothetical protein
MAQQSKIGNSDNSQTAVEWLANEISTKVGTNDLLDDLYKQAKAMEKEHIAKAWDAGYYGYFSLGIREIEFNTGEEYYDINYNETYNK